MFDDDYDIEKEYISKNTYSFEYEAKIQIHKVTIGYLRSFRSNVLTLETIRNQKYGRFFFRVGI